MATLEFMKPWYAATLPLPELTITKASPGFGYAPVFCFSDLRTILSWSMSATRAVSRAQRSDALYETTPMAERIQRIVITIMSSTSENAFRFVRTDGMRMFMGR